LSDAGNSVIIIEHNLDVIKCADYIIDLGPEGGEKAVKLFLRAHQRIAASVKHLTQESI